jgi:amino acid transporter
VIGKRRLSLHPPPTPPPSIVVALGALLGIVTGVLVGQMAVARIFSAVGRAHLLFPVIGNIHYKYHTPAVA